MRSEINFWRLDTMPHPAHGRFIWYDLMTTDQAAAKSFYNQLVGWGTQPFEGSGMPYTMWTAGKNPIGGVMDLAEEARQAGAPPHWVAYVAVTDVAATCDRTVELGGAVLHPATDIDGAGSFAILQDPQGAPFAVYTSGSLASNEPGPPSVGAFSWHELATTDLETASSFYADLFGWETKEDMDMGDGWVYRIFGCPDGAHLGGMFTKTDAMPGPPMWLYYITVDDLDGALERLDGLGGRLLNGPMEVPGGDRIAQCMDPQGAAFALHAEAHQD
jgi:predicted enzyme related to lactoylglutathione lyase